MLDARHKILDGANCIWGHLKSVEASIPKGVIHTIPLESSEAVEHKNNQKRRKWIRYERKHSNSMWHTDYKQLDDGRWFISYEDDASRFVTGWGVFDKATAEHAMEVLDRAIAGHGKPKSISSDRGSQLYATGSEKKKKTSAYPSLKDAWSIWIYCAELLTRRPTASWNAYTKSCNASCICPRMWLNRQVVHVQLTRPT